MEQIYFLKNLFIHFENVYLIILNTYKYIFIKITSEKINQYIEYYIFVPTFREF